MGISKDGLRKSFEMWREGHRIGLRGARRSRLDRGREEGVPGRAGDSPNPQAHPRKGLSGCEELS